jgi:D-alanyl-D-alanine carboxypeptidase/D-alanyl-D-alanine-endopeptidase (penicillin-binding protein 4)
MIRLASFLSSSRRSGLAFVALLCAACAVLALASPLAPASAPAASSASSPAAASAAAAPEAAAPEATAPEAAPPAASSNAPALDERIDDLINRWQAGQAFWGIAVLDLESGRTIYTRNAEKAFLPASNQKIVTAATALDALGAIYRYETTLRFDGTTEGAVMRGDLVLDGSGDPTFGSVEVGGTDPLRSWAEELADLGVERIEGRLIGDDDRFDDRPYPEGWDVDYITKQAGRYMGTSAGGLSYNDNVVSVRVDATRPGAPPSVRVRPGGAVEIQNEAVTSSRWRGSTLQVDRIFETNKLVLTGSVARSYRGTVNVPVSNPTTFTLKSFVQHLNDVGIETDLEIADVDDLDRNPSGGEPLFVHLSPPLSEILSVINKESNNFYAEQVFRTYGWGGSARGGSRRTNAFLRRAGIDTRPIRINDGSGLSRKDLITPSVMVELLRHMDGHEDRDAFLASLPAGGERNTTLEYRLSREPIYAKTGSLRFVRSLSGYATRPDGSRVAFAIFANNYTGPSYQISRTIDDVVRTLTQSNAS